MSRTAATITDALESEGAYVIAIAGEFDLALADEAEAAVERAFEGDAPIIFDLSECRFIDSSAIRVFAMAARTAQTDGREILVAANDSQISRVFELTRLGDVVPLIATRDDALRRLGLIDS
jgi:anti-sigma B factor antagonist